MNVNRISLVQAICLILIITINRLSINVPQSVLIPLGSSAILNMIYVAFIAIIFTIIIINLFKKFPGKDIVDVSEFLGGNFLKYVIGIFICINIVLVASFLLRDFVDILHIIYYSDTPIIFMLAFFIIVCIIANLFGGQSILKTNIILTVLMVVSLLITFASVLPNITVQRIFPILGYGAYNTFFTGISSIFAFNGLSVLYLVPSMVDSSKDFKKASIIAVSIASILIVLATASSLLAFSFSTVIEKISPLYMLLSNNEFGRYLQHPESIFVFTWVLSFMTYLNIGCMLIVYILKKLTKVKNAKPFSIAVGIVFLIVALIPKSILQTRDIGTFISKYITIPITFLIFPIILILANLKQKRTKPVEKE